MKFKIWKEITTFINSKIEAIKDLQASGFTIETNLINEIAFPKSLDNVKFTVISLKQLGLCKGASFKEASAKAVKLGLRNCVAGDCLATRKCYTDQPENEVILMGIKPIKTTTGQKVFSLSGKNLRDFSIEKPLNNQKLMFRLVA